MRGGAKADKGNVHATIAVLLALLSSLPAGFASHGGAIVLTVAGGGHGDGANATDYLFGQPMGMEYGPDGSLYVADYFFDQVVRVTPAGKAVVLAGTGERGYAGDGGPARQALLAQPYDVALDAAGHVFVADASNGAVRRIDSGTGLITTVAGGGAEMPATNAWKGPIGMDPRIEIPADSIRFDFANTIAFAPDGTLYVGDGGQAMVWAVNLETGSMRIIAGNGSRVSGGGDGGPATSAGFRTIWAIAVDADGDLYISEGYGNRVRRVDAATGTISTFAGTGAEGHSGDGGPATAATFDWIWDIAFDGDDRLHVIDFYNNAVRAVDLETGDVSLVFRKIGFFEGLAIDPTGAPVVANNWPEILRWNATNASLDLVAGQRPYSGDGGQAALSTLQWPQDAVMDADGDIYIGERAQGFGAIRRIDAETGIIDTVRLGVHAWDLELGGPGRLFTTAWDHIQRVDATVSPAVVTDVTRDGFPFCDHMLPPPATLAVDFALCDNGDMAYDPVDGRLYMGDSTMHAIYAIDTGTGVISTFAGTGTQGHSGDGGPATAANLDRPWFMDLLPDGDLVFMDIGSYAIRRIDAGTGTISTLAGPYALSNVGRSIGPALLAPAEGVPLASLDTTRASFQAAGADGALFLGGAGRIWRVDPETQTLHAVFGNGRMGNAGDGGPALEASGRQIFHIEPTPTGGLLFTDPWAGRVRFLTAST